MKVDQVTIKKYFVEVQIIKKKLFKYCNKVNALHCCTRLVTTEKWSTKHKNPYFFPKFVFPLTLKKVHPGATLLVVFIAVLIVFDNKRRCWLFCSWLFYWSVNMTTTECCDFLGKRHSTSVVSTSCHNNHLPLLGVTGAVSAIIMFCYKAITNLCKCQSMNCFE